MDQPTPGIPVYAVKSLAGGQTKVLHRNLLLPLQGRLRQEGETVGEGVTDSEEEEEEKAVTPCVTRAPKGGPETFPNHRMISSLLNQRPLQWLIFLSIHWMETVIRRMPMTPQPPTLLLVVLPLLILSQQRPIPLSLIA